MHETSDTPARPDGAARGPLIRGASIAVLVASVIVPLAACDTGPNGWFGRKAEVACPRPQLPAGVQPQFNAQQIEIRTLRRRAFSGDFFSQLELGRRYEGERAADKNLEDDVEAATWYALSLANPEGYAPISPYGRRSPQGSAQAVSRFDDCRAVERRIAYHALDRLLSRMTSEEQEKVRNRVIYVMSTQGADGFRTLARMHDGFFGPYGEPSDNRQSMDARGRPGRPGAPAALSLFQRNDVDAYLYNYLAVQTGDVGAYVMLKDFERSSPRRAASAAYVEQKARRWIPPYEFYPPESPESGVPHSDESDQYNDGQQASLQRLRELPFIHIAEALQYLRITARPVGNEDALYPGDVQSFQAMIGRPQTGVFQPIEKVRAIQYAAVNGSSKAQLVLAVMYSEGVGVPRDYARAFEWYAEADKQGSAEAKYAMSTFFSLGVQGVADQDKAAAVVYQIDAALSGFKPSATRLQQVLAQVSRPRPTPRDRGYMQ
jgi:TPR repeat protein